MLEDGSLEFELRGVGGVLVVAASAEAEVGAGGRDAVWGGSEDGERAGCGDDLAGQDEGDRRGFGLDGEGAAVLGAIDVETHACLM